MKKCPVHKIPMQSKVLNPGSLLEIIVFDCPACYRDHVGYVPNLK